MSDEVKAAAQVQAEQAFDGFMYWMKKGTIWLAGLLVSDGIPRGDTLRIALVHTGVNLLMAISLLPFVHHIAKYVGRVG